MKLNEIIKRNETLSFVPNILNEQKLGQVILREFYRLTQCGLNMKQHRFGNCKQAANWYNCKPTVTTSLVKFNYVAPQICES